MFATRIWNEKKNKIIETMKSKGKKTKIEFTENAAFYKPLHMFCVQII